MKLVNNNLSPLPFYDDLKYQSHRKAYAFGSIYPLRTYKNYIIPFQAVLASGTTDSITVVKLHNFSTGTATDITAAIKSAGLKLEARSGFSILSYPGTAALAALTQEGLYYLSIAITGIGTIYSDIFSSSNNVDDCLLLTYSNSYELEFNGGVLDFSDGFEFKCYLPTQLGRPEYPFEEEVTERMGFSFVETQVSKKVYKFVFLAPEYLCDALRIVRMCDNKKVVSEGLTYTLTTFSMTPEWEEQGNLASVECEFETDTVVANLGGYTPTIPGEGGMGGGMGGVSNVSWGLEAKPQFVSLAVNEVSKKLSLQTHDHAGQIVRPDVLAVPSTPPSANPTIELKEHEYYMYFDVVSAVDGETPTASGTGGLDIDELWPELGGSSDNKVISSEHLPEDVVYDADLDNYYSKSDSDSRYVTLATEQVITGKKTFNNDVVFGGNGSKMFVPSTAGAGLYYMYFDVASAVNGETPTASGGGLDVDELWAELGGSSSNKVIASSHIPDLYVKNTGDTMEGDYTGFTSLISGYGTDSRRTRITSGNFSLLAATASWAGGVSAYSNDGSTLLSGLVGAYGESDNLKYIYMAGEYDNHILHIDLASKNVGIGTTSPNYRLHVVDYIYADRIRAAIPSKTWNDTNILADGGFNNNLYNAVDHNTCQTVLTWHNAVNGYGYRTRYSIASIRKAYNRWGHLRLSVGNSDDGSSVGALLDIHPNEGVSAYPSFYVDGKLYVPSSQGNQVFDIYIQ